jgi:hypothetical protein
LETKHLSGNSLEEIFWREPANALALRAIFLSGRRLDERIYDEGRLNGSDSHTDKGVMAVENVAP